MLEFRHLKDHKKPYSQKDWGTTGGNEYGRLMQGIENSGNLEDHINGINLIKFIKNQLVTKYKTVTYASFVADIRPQTNEAGILRLTTLWKRL